MQIDELIRKSIIEIENNTISFDTFPSQEVIISNEVVEERYVHLKFKDVLALAAHIKYFEITEVDVGAILRREIAYDKTPSRPDETFPPLEPGKDPLKEIKRIESVLADLTSAVIDNTRELVSMEDVPRDIQNLTGEITGQIGKVEILERQQRGQKKVNQQVFDNRERINHLKYDVDFLKKEVTELKKEKNVNFQT